MLPRDTTIDHGTLRRLIQAGAPVGAEVVGKGGSWGIVINYGKASQTLAATRGGPKTFRQFETLAGYMKDLGIVEYRVNAAQFEPEGSHKGIRKRVPDRRSLAASARMKKAHEAAAYDTWLREQVQASIDDPQPSVTDAQARTRMASHRQALQKKTSGKPAAKVASRAVR